MALMKYDRGIAKTVAPAPTRPRYSTTPVATAPMPREADTTGEEAPLSNEDIVSIILGATRTSGGGGAFTGETKPQRLAREAAARGAVAQANFLTTQLGQVPGQYASLIGQAPQAFEPARQAAETGYQTALQALQGRRGEAERLAAQGQTALGEYLAANQPRAYANLPQAQAPTLAPSTVAQYAAAIGAPTTAIGEAAAQAAVEAQAAGGGYNRLLDTLRAAESSGQASRLAELEMLRNVQGAGIQQLYGAGAQQLEATRQAALNQIAQQQAQQIFALQQAQAAREQSYRDALASLYGTGNLTYIPPTGQTPVMPDLSGVDFAALGRLIGGR